MKLGRSLTNILQIDYITDEEKEKLKKGEIKPSEVDPSSIIKMKSDVETQIKMIHELGLSHLELDGAVPNPFLDFTEDEIISIKETAKRYKVSLSLHLPYTSVGESINSIQHHDREIAVELQKRYIHFASKIGGITVIMHPGKVPYYLAEGKMLKWYKNSLIESLVELASYANKLGIKFHIENNTAYENFMVEPEELIEVIKEVRKKGVEIYLNFDIGHWFTRIDAGKEIKIKPEEVIKNIPSEYIYELHLNDYIPQKRIFHPPLNRFQGLLRYENLVNYFQICRKKNVHLIVMETAVRSVEDIINSKEIIKQENEEILKIYREAMHGLKEKIYLSAG